MCKFFWGNRFFFFFDFELFGVLVGDSGDFDLKFLDFGDLIDVEFVFFNGLMGLL